MNKENVKNTDLNKKSNCDVIKINGNPISINSLYRGRRFLTDEGRILKKDYGWQIKMQWKKELINVPVSVSVDAYFNNNKKRDLDNIAKIILDSLTGLVLVDDSLISELHIYRKFDKNRPRCELSIKKL